jgi:hypothetical protein
MYRKRDEKGRADTTPEEMEATDSANVSNSTNTIIEQK